MSRSNVVYAEDGVITFASHDGEARTYSYGPEDWKAYEAGVDPMYLNGSRIATPTGAAKLAVIFAAKAAEAAEAAAEPVAGAITTMGGGASMMKGEAEVNDLYLAALFEYEGAVLIKCHISSDGEAIFTFRVPEFDATAIEEDFAKEGTSVELKPFLKSLNLCSSFRKRARASLEGAHFSNRYSQPGLALRKGNSVVA